VAAVIMATLRRKPSRSDARGAAREGSKTMIAPRYGAALLTGTMLLLGLCSAAGTAHAGQAAAARPSIVVFLSDDEDLASHRVMEKTKALVADRGATFANAFVSYSFCCPSRATLLRGQYPHNHRIEGNEWPTGGYEKFRAMGPRGIHRGDLARPSRLPDRAVRQAD
jgi:hypothetical protein